MNGWIASLGADSAAGAALWVGRVAESTVCALSLGCVALTVARVF